MVISLPLLVATRNGRQDDYQRDVAPQLHPNLVLVQWLLDALEQTNVLKRSEPGEQID